MKISIFGTWYVGLVTWTCLAELGHEVMCMDVNTDKIEKIRGWELPIYEAWLQELVERNVTQERLYFTTDAKEAVGFATCLFNAVWTPPDKENGDKADLKYIFSVAETIARHADSYKLLINKSTVPVWTASMCQERMNTILKERWAAFQLEVASNPEFLREWAAIKDFLNPDRIVCGVHSDTAKWLLTEIYTPLTRDYFWVFFTDIKSAEIIKYASNAFLATKISFINEIASFVEKVGWNISDISRGMWMDKRIGPKFLHAGIWYGGSCFPKDIKALMASWKEAWYEFDIIAATERVNEEQKQRPIQVLDQVWCDYSSTTIGILWLAFKPRTDDIREAPSLRVVQRLLENKTKEIRLYDPVASENFMSEFPESPWVTYGSNLYDTAAWCNALIVLTEWDEFRWCNFERIKEVMAGSLLIDWRNIWDALSCRELWFDYRWVGK